MSYVCERCAVFKPRAEVTFETSDAAIEHVGQHHLSRLAAFVEKLTHAMSRPVLALSTERALRWALRDHNKELDVSSGTP